MSNLAEAYIEECKENIRALYGEYNALVEQQKRAPKNSMKTRVARDLNAVKCEINANFDDIRITQENMRGLNETAKQQHNDSY